MMDVEAQLAAHGKAMQAEGEQLIADMSDDALAEMWDEFCRKAEELGKLARGAHQELEARMRKRGATHLQLERWSGRMKPGAKSHTVDDPVHLRLRLLEEVSIDDTRAVFVQPPTPPMRVDQRGLNELHKRGGRIAEIINEERQTVTPDPRLVLTRKEVAG